MFLSSWKISYLTPIFKSGRRSDISNYRGIAILPTIAKLFESMVKDILYAQVKNSISEFQHGFMTGRSSATNLMILCAIIFGCFGGGDQADVIFTDFSKAFDKIDHRVLIRKLHKFGIHSTFLKWVSSYISGRKQYVRINGNESYCFSVGSGVPQGSHLGPILFLLFINDVVECYRTCMCLLYADDLKVVVRITYFSDFILVQEDSERFFNWCITNKLALNLDKCKVMSFSWKGHLMIGSYSFNNLPTTC